MIRIFLFAFCLFLINIPGGLAQTNPDNLSYSGRSFIDYQKTFKRPNDAANKKEANLKTLFELKGLNWPAKFMYIRSFKYDSQLEVWVKNSVQDEYKLLKIYKVCALAGALGPKRFEGDYQVPEGFYYIDRFNPNSSYYLSLGLNYPNASDRILGDPAKPGGDIFIHGGCATVGCIPILDDQIAELYILAANAKSAGQDFIPVHIFPIKYDVQKSYEYLARVAKDNDSLKLFANKMEEAFDYFEKYHQLPLIMIKDNGEYLVSNALPRAPRFQPVVKTRPKQTPFTPAIRNVTGTGSVTKGPEYTGGMDAFDSFLKNLGKELTPYLPEGLEKLFAQVEFVVDTDGTPVNFKILQGSDDYFNKELLARIQKMPKWEPALSFKTPVAKKMVQTVVVGAL